MDSDYDDKYMEIAFEQAREALEAGEVPIGCCFVNSDGEVIARGRNEVNLTKEGLEDMIETDEELALFRMPPDTPRWLL